MWGTSGLSSTEKQKQDQIADYLIQLLVEFGRGPITGVFADVNEEMLWVQCEDLGYIEQDASAFWYNYRLSDKAIKFLEDTYDIHV